MEDVAHNNLPPNFDNTIKIPEKSYAIAYLLWISLGLLGAHRFYARRWISGFLYVISAGLFFVGWAADLFLLYFMIKKLRLQMQEEAAKEAVIYQPDPLAFWAENKKMRDYLQFPLQVLFFLAAPLGFVAFVLLILNQLEMIFIMLGILVIAGFVGSIDKTIAKYQQVEKMPVIGDILGIAKDLQDYYFHNKPRAFFFYLFYPVVGFIGMLFSKSIRAEFKLFMKIIGALMVLLIIDSVFGYWDTYPPHLDWTDALFDMLIQLFTIFVVTVAFLMPTLTTSFQLRLSGKIKRLRFFTALALLISIPATVFIYQDQHESMSFMSGQILNTRFEKQSFKDELIEESEMFLSYYLGKRPLATKAPVEPIALDKQLTEKYQRHISGTVVADEANAFSIISIDLQESKWLAVRRKTIENNIYLLLVINGSGKCYRHWEKLPLEIRDLFVKNANSNVQLFPYEISKKSLMDD